MSIATYIKEIGRGKEGARALTQEQAHDLMSQVLDGRVTDLEIGAFAIAMDGGRSVDVFLDRIRWQRRMIRSTIREGQLGQAL